MDDARTEEVTAWITALDPQNRAIADAVGRAVHEAAPGVAALMKWGRRVFAHGRHIAYLQAARGYVTFGFFDGADLDDRAELRKGSGKQMRGIKLRAPSDVPTRHIKAWIRQTVSRAKKP